MIQEDMLDVRNEMGVAGVKDSRLGARTRSMMEAILRRPGASLPVAAAVVVINQPSCCPWKYRQCFAA